MSFMYERVWLPEGKSEGGFGGPLWLWEVGSYMGAAKCVDSIYLHQSEAAARVSYLNGGIHPELANMVMRLLPDIFRDSLIDPRALSPKGPQCIHGRYRDEPCIECDRADAMPPGDVPIL